VTENAYYVEQLCQEAVFIDVLLIFVMFLINVLWFNLVYQPLFYKGDINSNA